MAPKMLIGFSLHEMTNFNTKQIRSRFRAHHLKFSVPFSGPEFKFSVPFSGPFSVPVSVPLFSVPIFGPVFGPIIFGPVFAVGRRADGQAVGKLQNRIGQRTRVHQLADALRRPGARPTLHFDLERENNSQKFESKVPIFSGPIHFGACRRK